MFLDTCNPGDVVYCRQHEGRAAVTTTARFDFRQERVETDERGKERVVVDYYLWDLRNGREIRNPTNAWKTAEQYASLRSAGKVKLAGDVAAQDKKKEEAKKEEAKAAAEAA